MSKRRNMGYVAIHVQTCRLLRSIAPAPRRPGGFGQQPSNSGNASPSTKRFGARNLKAPPLASRALPPGCRAAPTVARRLRRTRSRSQVNISPHSYLSIELECGRGFILQQHPAHVFLRICRLFFFRLLQLTRRLMMRSHICNLVLVAVVVAWSPYVRA